MTDTKQPAKPPDDGLRLAALKLWLGELPAATKAAGTTLALLTQFFADFEALAAGLRREGKLP